MKTSQRGFIFTQQRPVSIPPVRMLMEGDALEKLKTLPPGRIRCFITSPPYRCKFSYGVEGECGLEDTLDEYLEYQVAVAKEMLRCATPDANLFYVIQDSFNGSGGVGGDFRSKDGSYKVQTIRGAKEKEWPRKAQLLIPERIRLAFAEVGWVPLLRFVWDKTDSRHGAIDRPSYSYEEILLFGASPDHYWNRDAVLAPFHSSTIPRVKRGFNFAYQDPLNRKQVFGTKGLDAMQNRQGAFLRSVWKINPGFQPVINVNGNAIKGIASFPLLLAEICVNLGSASGDIVCDPFSGLGTTLLAAAKWGRNSIGIELSNTFAAAARQRMKDEGY